MNWKTSKVQSRFRLHTLLFCVAVFILTALGLGLAVPYYETLVPRLLLLLPYIAAWALLFAFAFDSLVGDGKFSAGKIVLLASGIIVLSATVTHSVWFVITPKWSFSVSTDQSVYRQGEPVTITASLTNTGFITHSFTSGVSDPIVFSVISYYQTQVWFNPPQEGITEFSINPNQSLERSFIWNQTRNAMSSEFGEEIRPGRYYIVAYIPSAEPDTPIPRNLFWAWTSIDITSP